MMARRDNSDPTGIGNTAGPGPGRPTAACCTTAPRATSPASRSIQAQADGVERQGWGGADVPDFKADEIPPAAWARSS
jgi:formate dehydrogenase major subunit